MKNINRERGQTLVLLLIYVIIALTIASAAVTMSLVSSGSTDKVYQGVTALDVAESGAETAMLKLLRNPSYSGEDPFSVGTGTVKIDKTESNPYVFVSTGKIGNFIRKIQITVEYQNGAFQIVDWREIL